MHSLTRSLTHSFTRSLAHSPTQALRGKALEFLGVVDAGGGQLMLAGDAREADSGGCGVPASAQSVCPGPADRGGSACGALRARLLGPESELCWNILQELTDDCEGERVKVRECGWCCMWQVLCTFRVYIPYWAVCVCWNILGELTDDFDEAAEVWCVCVCV